MAIEATELRGLSKTLLLPCDGTLLRIAEYQVWRRTDMSSDCLGTRDRIGLGECPAGGLQHATDEPDLKWVQPKSGLKQRLQNLLFQVIMTSEPFLGLCFLLRPRLLFVPRALLIEAEPSSIGSWERSEKLVEPPG